MLARFRTFALAALGVAAGGLLAALPTATQNRQEPLARFEDPICPGIAGIQVESAEVMVDRIRDNLRSLGRRLAPETNCTPNFILAVVEDGQEYLESVMRASSVAFADIDPHERRALLSQSGPSRVVHRIRPLSRDGRPIPRREDLVRPPETAMWMAHSKIYTATRNDIRYALVLLDRGALADTTIGQLADYATFRALTRNLPETAEARSASIVGLFDGGTRPEGLTDFDLTYLRTLYTGLPNLPGTARLAELERVTGRKVFNQ
jgi:hypothetical protein